VIADNRLAELAGWDREIFRIELQGLADLDLNFDIEITGFETAALDFLLDDPGEPTKPDPADEVPPVAAGPAITRPGDLWLMGEHRLLCGDARDGEAVRRCCQSNANQSPKHRTPVLSGRQLTPLSQSCRAVLLKGITAVEMAVEVEMIVDRGVNGSKFLQGLDVSEPGHCSLSSSEWLMRVFGPVVEPPSTFLTIHISDHFHRGAV